MFFGRYEKLFSLSKVSFNTLCKINSGEISKKNFLINKFFEKNIFFNIFINPPPSTTLCVQNLTNMKQILKLIKFPDNSNPKNFNFEKNGKILPKFSTLSENNITTDDSVWLSSSNGNGGNNIKIYVKFHDDIDFKTIDISPIELSCFEIGNLIDNLFEKKILFSFNFEINNRKYSFRSKQKIKLENDITVKLFKFSPEKLFNYKEKFNKINFPEKNGGIIVDCFQFELSVRDLYPLLQKGQMLTEWTLSYCIDL